MEGRDLKSRIEIALVQGHLSQWQRQFLADIHARLVKYGPNVRLSEKQIDKLYEALTAATPRAQTPSPLRSVRPKSPRWQSRRRIPLAREARYLANRFVTAFGFMFALVIGSAIYSYVNSAPTTGPAGSVSAVSHVGTSTRLARNQFTITDGDTIRLSGRAKGTRLVGFNTPETIEPRCDAERELGRRAKARLKELTATASLELTMVACSCPPGTEGTDACNYSRSCGILRADGRDVGELLISEGLAVPFICGTSRCPPTPRPWCG